MNAKAIKEANTDGIKAVASEVGLGASAVEALEGGAALGDLVIGRGTPPAVAFWTTDSAVNTITISETSLILKASIVEVVFCLVSQKKGMFLHNRLRAGCRR
ncbi:hypothetical protein V6Z11_D13G198800 [Gossypium hirsutum]